MKTKKLLERQNEHLERQKKREIVALLMVIGFVILIIVLLVDTIGAIFFDLSFLPDLITKENYKFILFYIFGLSLAGSSFLWLYKTK